VVLQRFCALHHHNLVDDDDDDDDDDDNSAVFERLAAIIWGYYPCLLPYTSFIAAD
jgi:hypothetical protein